MLNRIWKLWTTGMVVLLLAACGGEEGGEGEGEGEGEDGYTGGNFTVTIQSVDDGCWDGALNTAILPDGTPRDLPAPINLPAIADITDTTTIDISLNEPFQSVNGVPVTAQGTTGLTTKGDGFVNDDIDFQTDADKTCLVDTTISATITFTDNDNLTGTGTITVTAADGDDCPVLAADVTLPCEINAPLTGVRAE